MYKLMSFDKCKQLYNQHHNQDIKYFVIISKRPFVSPCKQCPPITGPRQSASVVTLVFPISCWVGQKFIWKELSELFGQPSRISCSLLCLIFSL